MYSRLSLLRATNELLVEVNHLPNRSSDELCKRRAGPSLWQEETAVTGHPDDDQDDDHPLSVLGLHDVMHLAND